MDARKLADLEVRVDMLIWIPGILHASALPEAFEELIEDICSNDAAPLRNQWRWLRKFLADTEDEPEWALQEALQDELRERVKTGFLALIARPVFDYKPDGKSAFYSWGHYNTAWIYGRTMNAVLKRAEAWGTAADERQRASAKAAAPAGTATADAAKATGAKD